MTNVEYGGGPDMEQRRNFAGLKEDAYVPGYLGHCPQLKYSIGKTYGLETHELNRARRCRRHQLLDQCSQSTSDDIPRHQWSTAATKSGTSLIPESDGTNKYMQNMVPGYSGYVPRWPFKFGRTYREECDLCLEEFLANYGQTMKWSDETKVLSKSQPNLNAISSDPTVRDHLNSFSDRKFGTSGGVVPQQRRQLTEAPIPGYRGFIPRIGVTELGLGGRYHNTTESGLSQFYTTLDDRTERLATLGAGRATFGAQRIEPISVNRNPVGSVRSGSRIYLQDGMIPKYTGFIPHQKYAIGFTYGDETRSLDVCSHDQPSYGAFVRQQHQAMRRQNTVA
jgi:hypothetical protein